MKLADWAREQGIDYKTAHRWFRAGQLPVRSEQMPTGTIPVYPTPKNECGVALYARVSSHDQRADLNRRSNRLSQYAAKQDKHAVAVVSEVGSGMNGHRKRLLTLLKDPLVSEVMAEHRDRLTRFGSEYTEAAMSAAGRRLTVLDTAEVEYDLVRNMTEVLTSFCARLYGRRSARNRAKKALEAAGSAY